MSKKDYPLLSPAVVAQLHGFQAQAAYAIKLMQDLIEISVPLELVRDTSEPVLEKLMADKPKAIAKPAAKKLAPKKRKR